jgi:hypothetical protein
VASSTTEPPLSIALGDWGSGKSSFMVQMEAEVERLADLSRNNLGQSIFAASIRQIGLWSGLVEHLFRSLGQQEPAEDPDPAAVRARPATALRST